MYDEMLALTGAGTIAIGALQLEHWWVAAIAGGVISAGVLFLRLHRRRAEQ